MSALWVRLNLAALAAAVLSQVVGLDRANAAISGTCATDQTTYTVSTDTETAITSGAFVDLPETVVNFVQGGTRAGCVVVTFSAEAFAGAGVVVSVRPVMDNTIFAVPREARFVSESPNEYDSHAMTFIFRNVAPGRHRIKMQVKGETGRVPEIGVRSTVVQHLK